MLSNNEFGALGSPSAKPHLMRNYSIDRQEIPPYLLTVKDALPVIITTVATLVHLPRNSSQVDYAKIHHA